MSLREKIVNLVPANLRFEETAAGYKLIHRTFGHVVLEATWSEVTYCHHEYAWLSDKITALREVCPYCSAEAWNPALNCCDSCCCQ